HLVAELLQHPSVLEEVALQRQDADSPRHRYQPRTASSSRSPSDAALMPRIGSPSPRDTSASSFASWKCVVALTIAAARFAGLSDLKMPDPTNTPSEPICITSAASAGVAMPPATKVTTGSRPSLATCLTRSYGAPRFFASVISSSSGR